MSIKKLIFLLFSSFFLVSTSVLFSSCDNSVEFSGRDIYSVYGSLNLKKDTNYVRVKNLKSSFTKDETDSLGVSLRIKNESRGVEEVLRDSVKLFENVYTHNFQSTIGVYADNTYNIKISEGGKTVDKLHAFTPTIARLNLPPPGKTCRDSVDIVFENVIGKVDLSIGVKYGGSYEFYTRRYPPDTSTNRIEVPTTIQTILIRALGANIADPPDPERKVRCHHLDSNLFKVRYNAYGPQFFKAGGGTDGPVDSSEAEVPGTLKVFGGFYRDSSSFTIDTTDVYSNT